MSETSILPGAGSSTESDADMVPPGTGFDDVEGAGDRRRFLIIGAVAGVIVLIVAAYLLLRGGGSSSPEPFVPSNAGPVPSAAPSAGSGGNNNGGHTPTLPKKAKHASVVDPFNPLVLPPVTASTGPVSTTKVKAGPPTLPTAPPAPVVTAPVPTAPPSEPANPQSNNGPQSIQLKRIHGRVAVFDVFYPHHKFRRFAVEAPKAGSQSGTVFDKIFSLIGIQNSQATIQIGDDTPFDLSKGVSHTV
jgi:hypothetical protein